MICNTQHRAELVQRSLDAVRLASGPGQDLEYTLDTLRVAGADIRFRNGRYRMRLAGVAVRSTAGAANLFAAWQSKAEQRLAALKTQTQPQTQPETRA